LRDRRQRQHEGLGRRHGRRLGAPGRDVRVLPHAAEEQLGGRLAAGPVPVPRGQRRGREAGDPLPQGGPPCPRRTGRRRSRRRAGLARRAGRAAARPEGAAEFDVGDRMTLTVEHATLPVLGRLPAHSSRTEQIAHIAEAAKQIRIQDLKLVHYAGAGHIGGDFSAIDILATLYGAVLDVAPENVDDPERDRFILSKGHIAGALYVTLAAYGFIPVEDLATFLKPLSKLNGHPNRNYVRGVEATTGTLGHGLPIAVGHALSAKLDVSQRRTYVLVGDGELQEGSNWEAMMAASHHELDRLTVIVDRNRLQQGATVR